MIIPHQGRTPRIGPSVFVAEGAMVIGDVFLEKGSSVWFNAVLRGDINSIQVGERSNIQDLCALHVTRRFPVHIGSDVTVGHAAIIHGATVGNCCLIGMGATLLDNVRVGSYCIVAAGALLKEGMEVPEGMLVAGVPAAIRRSVTAEERTFLEESARNYVQYVQSYLS